jgi:hypothetical protein
MKGDAAFRSNAAQVPSGRLEKDEAKQQRIIHVSQHALATAPLLRQKQALQGTIVTSLRRSGQSLEVTLYPSPLFQQQDLDRVRVQEISQDSLRLTISGTVITIPLPSQSAQPIR